MLHKSKPVAWLGLALLITSAIAWQTKAHTPQTAPVQQDTIPKKESAQEDETIIRGDLDKAMEEVKKAQENLERQLQKNGFDKMQKDLIRARAQMQAVDVHAEIEKAMRDIDLQKLDLDQQMKNIDMQKIKAETQKALEKINWDKMKKDMADAQTGLENNIDTKKMEMEIRRSLEDAEKGMARLKEIDLKKMRQELDRTREDLRANEGHMREEIERAKKDMDLNFHKDFKKEMEKAKEAVEKAHEELRGYKEMVTAMQKDGLLKNDGNYTIKYKKGELYIDGVKQSEEVTNKYRHYFKQDNVQLRKTNDDDGKTIDL
jgi:hypothetical protein